jgi:hypothetical protein
MEKLVDRHIRDQTGKSTETALHNVVTSIENAIEHKDIALGAFVDIEGPFDRTSFDIINQAAERHGTEPTVCRWICAMLENKKISATLSGETLGATAARGCPQVGVLSPLLWSLVMDNLHWGLNNNGYYTIRYADDIAILINGKFPQTVSEVLQTALCTLQRWCERTKLSINPNLMVVIPFTRKRNIKRLREQILFSKRIQLSSEVKYLAVTLGKGLTWKKQLDKVIAMAYKVFWICRGTFGKTWGLKPKVVYQIYQIRPIVTYAAAKWLPRVKLKTSQAELSKLQKMACLGITGAMRTASTASLKVLLGLPPLHLQVEAEAKIGNYRLHCNKQWKPKSEGSGHA